MKKTSKNSAKKKAASDSALLEVVLQGDPKGYAELFERNAERIRRMAYLLLHNSVATEDAVQETFTRGLSSLETFRGEAKFDVWLYSIGLNVCRQTLRRAKVQEDSVDSASLEKGRRPGRAARGVLTSLMRRETAQRLAIALGFLTNPQREVFVLHYVEGLPYESVARMLDVSVVGARGLALRAREVLRAKLPPGLLPPQDS